MLLVRVHRFVRVFSWGCFHGAAGKSNLMDAICFGMGLRAGALRGGNLAELIYSGETGEVCVARPVQNPCSFERVMHHVTPL